MQIKKYVIVMFSFLTLNNLFAVTCIAHRGLHQIDGKAVAEKNSAASIKKAIEYKIDAIEFDVLHTKDGVGVIAHFQKIEKEFIDKNPESCPKKKQIGKIDYQVLTTQCQTKDYQQIFTLPQFLAELAASDSIAVIELKDMPSENTLSLIKEYYYHQPSKVKLISFKNSVLKKIVKWEKSDPWWKNVKRLKLTVFPMRANQKKKNRLGIVGIDILKMVAPKWYLAFVVNRGHEVSAWTVNDYKKIDSLQKSKVDYITTDEPLYCMISKIVK